MYPTFNATLAATIVADRREAAERARLRRLASARARRGRGHSHTASPFVRMRARLA